MKYPAVSPDLLPPHEYGPIHNGYWAYRGEYGKAPTVVKMCSSREMHSIGRWNDVTNHGPRAIYSTPELALMAVLHEIEKEMLKAEAMLRMYEANLLA